MLPPHPCWLALLLTRREVGCLCCLVNPASLADWRCSCLCSESIPSVTENSVIFVKELSFPQTAPTDDAFFNWNWAGACRGRRSGPGLLMDWAVGCRIVWAETGSTQCWSAGFEGGTPLQKQERGGVG